MRVDSYGILYKKQAVVVPRPLQNEITEMSHRLSHARREKSGQFMKERFFWFKMWKTFEDYCQFCDVCMENKRRHRKRASSANAVLYLKQPSVSIAMDIATLPWSSGCHRFMLSIIDYFPNSSRSSPCMTVESVRDALVVGWIYWHGLPRVLLTDHGRNVDGQVTQKLCSDYGIV